MYSGLEWTWEQWQWRGTLHSWKLQGWSLTIRGYTVVSRTLVWERGSYSSTEGQSVYCTASADWAVNSVYDLKAAQKNVQRCLIQEPLLYESELGHNVAEAIKNICERWSPRWSWFRNQKIHSVTRTAARSGNVRRA